MIPVLRPSVPSVDRALPYLKRMEEARHYTNFGPLSRELEQRLSDHYSGAYVVTVSSCTAGLELVYMLRMMSGYRAIELPALTFCATWLAATRAGLEIRPIDVDPDTWIAPGVAGYGLPSYAPVVDAAGAFGEQSVPIVRGGMTAVFSGHATKPLGFGEAGWVVTWDQGEDEELRRMSNFGIQDGRSIGPGTNAKMSEFTAAMGLAALDQWCRDPWLALEGWYAKYLPACATPQRRPLGCYSLFPVKTTRKAIDVHKALLERGVETKSWYCPPMHRHPMYEKPGNRKERRNKPIRLPVTDALAESLLCLPYHLDMTESTVRQVCETLEEVLTLENVHA